MMHNTTSNEVTGMCQMTFREGKHMTDSELCTPLTRTGKSTDDIEEIQNQAMLIDEYLARRLCNMEGKFSSSEQSAESSSSAATFTPWSGGGAGGMFQKPSWREGFRNTKKELTLQSILNTYHPVLDNLANYLTTRDLIQLTNTSHTLRTLFYKHSVCWRNLDFSYKRPISEARRLQLLKNRRRIGFDLQNKSVYPEVGFTSEIAVDICFRIPMSYVRTLVLDGTDISDYALRTFLNKTKRTLGFLSIRDCAHINACNLLEYFSRENVGYPRALKRIQFRGIPGVLSSSGRCEFIEGVSELGEAISGLFAVLGSLGIKADVGFCAAGIEYCQTVLENYPHAINGDGVIGLKKKRKCGRCQKSEEEEEALCKICEEERTCRTCEEGGHPTFICRECEPDSLDGLLWPHYCDCGRALCEICFDRNVVLYRDCPCFQCKECEKEQYLWPSERIRVDKYRCDHCGLDKCPKCWVLTGIKLKKCVGCDRGLCETCGIQLACAECNACVCENCYSTALHPIIPQGYEWLCDYCHGGGGTYDSISGSKSASSSTSCITCPTCVYFGSNPPPGVDQFCGCSPEEHRSKSGKEKGRGDCYDWDREMEDVTAEVKEESYCGSGSGGRQLKLVAAYEDPWTIASSSKQKRINTDLGGSEERGGVIKRLRLEDVVRSGSAGGPGNSYAGGTGVGAGAGAEAGAEVVGRRSGGGVGESGGFCTII